MAKLILTLMAKDRPGLVRAVSDIVVAHGGNWLESRMANLAGTFTGLVLVEVADARKSDLSAALQAFATDDITISLRESSEGDDTGSAEHLVVSIVGADHPGIVNELAELLVSRDVNIAKMKTDHEPPPCRASLCFRPKSPPACRRGSSGTGLRPILNRPPKN